MTRGAAEAVKLRLRALRRRRARRSLINGSRGAWLGAGAMASCAIILAGLNATGVANAQCVLVNGASVGASCPNTPHGTGSRQDNGGAQPGPASTGVTQIHSTSFAPAGAPPVVPSGDVATASSVGDPMAVAASMVGTDAFGAYGCEDFVDAVYGRTTATGIAHDSARSFFESLADQGLAHHEVPIPRGALVFSAGPDGEHVDISRGDGTYYSGGVQGISAGYGDGHDIQVLPAANLGSFTLHGWAYPPW
jgi:hypothetical protein